MKKLVLLLVAMAVAVSASADVSMKLNRPVKHQISFQKEQKVAKVAPEMMKAKRAPMLGVITSQPEGEVKTYDRSGDAIFPSGSSIYYGSQSNRMDIVYAEDGKVYMKDILYGTGDAYGHYWVEGRLNEEGTQITVPLGQSIYYSDYYAADILLCWGSTWVEEDEDGAYLRMTPDEEVTEVVYTIDGDVIYGPEGIAPDPDAEVPYANFWATGLTLVWSDDGSFGGAMEWNTVLTLSNYVAPTIITEQPEGELFTFIRDGGTITAGWGVSASEAYGKLEVVINNETNKAYIHNPLIYYASYYDAWVEGDYDAATGTITVPAGQYLSWNENYEYGIIVVWGDTWVSEDEDGYMFEYSVDQRATEIVYQIDGDKILLLGSSGDINAEFPNNYVGTGLMGIWSDDLTFTALEFSGANEVAGELLNAVPAAIENPVVYKWYDCGDESGYSYLSFGLPKRDTENGKVLDPEAISYSIFTDDDQIFTFDMDTYYYDELMEDLTEIPYWIFSTGYDLTSNIIYFYRTNYGENPMFDHRIGIQVFYTVDDITNASDIVYIEVPKPEAATPADPTDLSFYDSGSDYGLTKINFTLPSEDVNGNALAEPMVSYSIFTDNNVPFVFDAYTYYYDIDEDITEVPYSVYNNGYDFGNSYTYFYATNEGDNPLFENRIGVQAHYTVGGVKRSSNIVYWPGGEAEAVVYLVILDKDGNENYILLNQGVNGEYTTTLTLDYGTYGTFWYGNEDRPNVPFYFVINDVAYGAENDLTATNLGYALANPLTDGSNYYTVPVGYSYTLGVSKDGNNYYVYAAQSGMTGVEEMNANKEIASERYFNVAGQEMAQPEGMTIKVTTYTDGTSSATKVVK